MRDTSQVVVKIWFKDQIFERINPALSVYRMALEVVRRDGQSRCLMVCNFAEELGSSPDSTFTFRTLDARTLWDLATTDHVLQTHHGKQYWAEVSKSSKGRLVRNWVNNTGDFPPYAFCYGLLYSFLEIAGIKKISGANASSLFDLAYVVQNRKNILTALKVAANKDAAIISNGSQEKVTLFDTHEQPSVMVKRQEERTLERWHP